MFALSTLKSHSISGLLAFYVIIAYIGNSGWLCEPKRASAYINLLD